MNWVRAWQDGTDYAEHRNGVLWSDAPLPPAWHKCRAQTRAWHGGHYTERCRCGAISLDRSPWLEKNQTRHHRRRDRGIAASPLVRRTCRDCGRDYETNALAPDADGQCDQCWGDRLVREYGL